MRFTDCILYFPLDVKINSGAFYDYSYRPFSTGVIPYINGFSSLSVTSYSDYD